MDLRQIFGKAVVPTDEINFCNDFERLVMNNTSNVRSTRVHSIERCSSRESRRGDCTVNLEGLFQPVKKSQNSDPQTALLTLGLFWHFSKEV